MRLLLISTSLSFFYVLVLVYSVDCRYVGAIFIKKYHRMKFSFIFGDHSISHLQTELMQEKHTLYREKS